MATKKAGKRKRVLWEGLPQFPPGDYTSIRIPIPQPSSWNKDRPISDLIKAQLKHIQHAESARLPKERRDGRRAEDIHTEAEAASYIAAVTKVLHPLGRKRTKRKASS